MPFEFREAIRENVGLLISLAAPSGAGKTLSAMKLAKGICGNDPFAVIDTEARRSLHYADSFRFDFVDLKPPFSPVAYTEAIGAAEARGYKAVVIDSISHEHSGEGGVLDWQEQELMELVARAKQRGDSREEWKLMEAYNQLSWQKPKKAHKRMVDRFLQCRSHLIFCMRAEDKIEFKKDSSGKTVVVPKETLSGYKGWIPICDKRFLFEMTASFILLPDRPGVPNPIKLQQQHRAFFSLDKPISEEAGAKLAEWARGGAPVASTMKPAESRPVSAPPPRTSTTSAAQCSDCHAPAGKPHAISCHSYAPANQDESECSVSDFENIEIACTASQRKIRLGAVKTFVVGELGYDSYGQLKKKDLKKVYDFIGPEAL